MDAKNLAMVPKPEPDTDLSATILERVLVGGDLSPLSSAERVSYYQAVCRSLHLNPLSKPFDYLMLNNKLTLYAKRDCTDQLRQIRGISVRILSREKMDDVYIVTAQATDQSGRQDESIGVVPLHNLRGETLANALMKAETKAKRRVTLSICGLGMLDETEIDSIPGARPVPEPAGAAPVQIPTPRDPEPVPINEAQRRRLFATLKECGVTHLDFKAYLVQTYALSSTTLITTQQYNKLIDAIQDGTVAQWIETQQLEAERAAIQDEGSEEDPFARTGSLGEREEMEKNRKLQEGVRNAK